MGAVVLKPHYKPLIFGSCFLWQPRSSAAELCCLLKQGFETRDMNARVKWTVLLAHSLRISHFIRDCSCDCFI